MHMNTTYKAFVAKAATEIMAKLVGQAAFDGSIEMDESYEKNEQMFEHYATLSAFAAEELARTLSQNWRTVDDGTVFFDVEDTLTSGIEKSIDRIDDTLSELKDGLREIRDAVMC